MRGGALLFVLAALAGCGGSATRPPASGGVETAAGSAQAAPLFVEYVVIRRQWVEKYVPPPGSSAAANRLGEELLGRWQPNAESRRVIADSVQVVLGEAATNDANRPKAAVVERDRLASVRLAAAAKAAIQTFAASAHPGDRLPSPAVDGDVVVVARALVVPR